MLSAAVWLQFATQVFGEGAINLCITQIIKIFFTNLCWKWASLPKEKIKCQT